PSAEFKEVLRLGATVLKILHQLTHRICASAFGTVRLGLLECFLFDDLRFLDEIARTGHDHDFCRGDPLFFQCPEVCPQMAHVVAGVHHHQVCLLDFWCCRILQEDSILLLTRRLFFFPSFEPQVHSVLHVRGAVGFEGAVVREDDRIHRWFLRAGEDATCIHYAYSPTLAFMCQVLSHIICETFQNALFWAIIGLCQLVFFCNW